MKRSTQQLLLAFTVPLLAGAAAACVEGLFDQITTPPLRHFIPPAAMAVGLLLSLAGAIWAAMLATDSAARRVPAAVAAIACGTGLFFLGATLMSFPLRALM